MEKNTHIPLLRNVIRENPQPATTSLPDNSVSTDDELGFGVPLVVGNVVVSLQPNPLLTFGQEAIIAGFTLSKLHYYKEKRGKLVLCSRITNRLLTYTNTGDFWIWWYWHTAFTYTACDTGL